MATRRASRTASGALSLLRRSVVPLVIAAFVVVAAVVYLGEGDDQKTLTAYFPRTVSLYEGSDVRVLGVGVGTVDTITPEGTRVKVVMSYDQDIDLPAQAKAVIISPTIVGDRYVQLTPPYTGGDKMDDDATIEVADTGVPLELDQIYDSLDDLTVALGPNGANSTGALTDLLQVTAENFGGQGEQFNQTIKNFGRLSETLDDNKDELFDSTAELSKFITKLANNDDVVRDFNKSLGRVSTVLSGEREELATSLKNLAVALDEVGSFVKQNRQVLGDDISGLNRVAKVLVRRRDSLDQILRIAPVALNNLALTYNPDAGTLDTNSNITELIEMITQDPKQVLCSLVSANDPDNKLCDLIQGLPLPRTGLFGAGAGTGSSYGDTYDPTLGGLVEVKQ